MKKWLHTLVTIGGLVLTIASPQIQAAIATHPSIAAGLIAGYTVLGHILPSPMQAGS